MTAKVKNGRKKQKKKPSRNAAFYFKQGLALVVILAIIAFVVLLVMGIFYNQITVK